MAVKMEKLSPGRIYCPGQVKDWITYGKNRDWGWNQSWKKMAIITGEHKNLPQTFNKGVIKEQKNLVHVKKQAFRVRQDSQHQSV